MADDEQILRLMLTAGLAVAILGGVIAVAVYSLGGRGRLFPPVGPPRSTLTGAAVVGAFAVFIFTSQLVLQFLDGTGFFSVIYGAGFPAGWPEKSASTIRFLWAATLAFPIQVLLMLGLVRLSGGRGPWTTWKPSSQVATGYLTWLLVTPAAFSVFILANMAHTYLTSQPPDKHPLTELGQNAGTREWSLFVLQTVVIAAVLEELLFRGLLLPWLAQRRPRDPSAPLAVAPPVRPWLIMVLAVMVALLFHLEDMEKSWTAGDRSGAAAHLVPGVVFVALLPLLVIVPRLRWLRRHLRVRSRQDVQAVLASSALFAAMHAHVWPSPVPLFVLAIGLGYLYLRTQSLIGPVVVHSLFNAVSAVYLLLTGTT